MMVLGGIVLLDEITQAKQVIRLPFLTFMTSFFSYRQNLSILLHDSCI